MRFLVLARAKALGITSDKARGRRLSRLQSSMVALQSKVKRDLRSSDPNRFLTALAVGLMVDTGEDPVFSWQKRNVQLDDKVAYFRGKGKRKAITNAAVIRALADAYEAVEDGDDELFAHDTGRVTADMVGDYLSGFKLGMDDIRGFNAGHIMHGELSKRRTTGPELPRHKRSRAKLLQGEFFDALDATASEVGLEAEMIRYNFLPPGLEASYLSDGSLEKQASVSHLTARVAARFLKTRE